MRVYQEQLRARLDQTNLVSREEGLSGGGWLNFALFKFDQPGTEMRTLRQYQARVWGDANYRGIHRFYVRGLTEYDDWNHGDEPFHGDDWVEPRLERGWYQFDLGQMIRNASGKAPDLGFRVRVGRDYTTIGTALALATPLDMVRFDLEARDWQFMAFLGKTIRSELNIDRSPNIRSEQRRCFWGAQFTWLGLEDHQPFVYFLNNQDNSEPDPDDPAQAYEYTSRYVGIGSTGRFFIPNLHYSTELVGEWGKTYSDTATENRDRIEAMAFDFMLEYFFDLPTRPRVMAEYIFATGDNDRLVGSGTTVGGNMPGTKDHAFNGFGFRDTGLVLAPEVSNLNAYVLGASFFPLEHIKLFRRLELGTKVFFFQKAARNGALSDVPAQTNARWVGWEWDLFANWQITSDLIWSIRYGAFQPGDAFVDNGCGQFLYTGFTLSF
ncbi:MAG: hypothetical protein BWX88_00636 [Planctomycetes bacterium ADurb.Bin126]|nr:MAG: hypothetical protein BWX88_00636 [Planctomycetes bacterium ADurb.Bin126]HOD80920.1 alginate export family protein [Phycisphaerae bacterium]HQL75065.1 alginate export family protein [Phycisphaerae bacterium]